MMAGTAHKAMTVRHVAGLDNVGDEAVCQLAKRGALPV